MARPMPAGFALGAGGAAEDDDGSADEDRLEHLHRRHATDVVLMATTRGS